MINLMYGIRINGLGYIFCAIGKHDFRDHISFRYGSWDECERCGERRYS